MNNWNDLYKLLKSFAIIFTVVLGFVLAVGGAWRLGNYILNTFF